MKNLSHLNCLSERKTIFSMIRSVMIWQEIIINDWRKNHSYEHYMSRHYFSNYVEERNIRSQVLVPGPLGLIWWYNFLEMNIPMIFSCFESLARTKMLIHHCYFQSSECKCKETFLGLSNFLWFWFNFVVTLAMISFFILLENDF